jgi:hypothetical protein
VVDRGYRDYYYKPHYEDTNGVIDTFYFGQQENIATASKGKADSAVYNISSLTVNKGSARYIWVKDDDGLLRGGRFVVFADSAPPAPTVGAVKAGDSIRVEWFGHDKKDSCFTEFRILYKKSAVANPAPTLNEVSDSLIGWNVGLSAFNYDAPSQGYSYTFKPTGGAGYYFFQVIARDKRGTKSYSTKVFVNF